MTNGEKESMREVPAMPNAQKAARESRADCGLTSNTDQAIAMETGFMNGVKWMTTALDSEAEAHRWQAAECERLRSDLAIAREALEKIIKFDCGCLPCRGQCDVGRLALIKEHASEAIARLTTKPTP